MTRKLPDDPTKRRRQVFKRCFQHLEHWQALREDRGMEDIITTPDGEDVYMGDLMVGIEYLPPRQRQAFELICLRGYTETAARDELLPNSKSSTPVQQYADSALIRMIEAYDLKQEGKWPPEGKQRRRRATPKKEAPVKTEKKPPKTKENKVVSLTIYPTTPKVVNNIVKQHLLAARDELLKSLAETQEALAYIEDQLGIQPVITNGCSNPSKPRLGDVARLMTEEARV